MTKLETFSQILTLVGTLSRSYIEELITIIQNEDYANANTISQYVEKEKSTEDIICPCCHSKHIVRNGHRKEDGKQRYLCRECDKSFTADTNTVVTGTRKKIKVWEKYIECMMLGLSVRKTAEMCGIHRNTAFIWRHKILDALRKRNADVVLEGIIEADETFFPVSYKGNHTNSLTFTMPRPARHRGNDHVFIEVEQDDGNVEIVMMGNKRGLSLDKVCVPCAVNRKGGAVAVVGKLGKVSYPCVEKALGNRIKEYSTICTDCEKAYKNLSQQHGLNLIQFTDSKSKKGIYNIQHINSYHSQLKNFLYHFKGVSTKYLNNYLVWHNYVNYAEGSYKDKRNNFLRDAVVVNITTTNRNISNRPALPLLC